MQQDQGRMTFISGAIRRGGLALGLAFSAGNLYELNIV